MKSALPVAAFIVLSATTLVSGQVATEPIDLSSPGAIEWGTAEPEIIDTRLFQPQLKVVDPWTGPVQSVGDHLPLHWRDKRLPIGPGNDLPVGGLLDATRVWEGPLFPAVQQTPWSPPDPTIAVGSQYIVETVNMVIAFFDKSNQTMVFSQNLDDTGNPGFFEPLGAGNFTFDPKCMYDQVAQRFVVVALEKYGTTQSFIDIAVSDDSDPNGIWYKYRTNSVVNIGGNLYWVDYPGIGYDGQAYYITGNLFPLSGGNFGGVIYRSFDKIPLLSGGTAAFTTIRDGSSASMQVAHHFGSNQAPFFVSTNTSTTLRVQALRNALTSPTLSTTSVTVPSYGGPSGGAPNIGGTIDTIDGRINNVHWRDGKLYAGHGIGSGGKTIARWYQMNTNNWPASGSVTLAMSGNIDGGSGVHTWFPAIFSNEKGDVGVAMAASAAAQVPTIKYTGRRPTDPPGTMGTLKTVTISGAAGYSGRWGDYFGLAVDPNNDRMFWYVGEYGKAGGVWGTWIGAFFITPVGGDLNCDGSINQFDISHFVQALSDPSGYSASHPNCDIIAGDVNEDGTVNQFDISPFVELLGG